MNKHYGAPQSNKSTEKECTYSHNCPIHGYKSCSEHSPAQEQDWEKELKPKVTIFKESDKRVKEIALMVLNEYWEDLKPGIRTLLSSHDQQLLKEVEAEIRQMIEKEDIRIWQAQSRILDQVLQLLAKKR